MAKVEISDNFVSSDRCMGILIDSGIKLKICDYDTDRGVILFDAWGDLIPDDFEKCSFEVFDDGDKAYLSNVYEVKE